MTCTLKNRLIPLILCFSLSFHTIYTPTPAINYDEIAKNTVKNIGVSIAFIAYICAIAAAPMAVIKGIEKATPYWRRFTRPKLKNKITFANVAGYTEVIKELQTVVKFLKHPEKFARVKAHIPAGILLEGPPGTGKTLLARAVAGEADCEFISISASEIQNMWVGSGPKRIRELFHEARLAKSAIIFIDEIDSIGGNRGKMNLGEYRNTVNELLTQMDGFSTCDSVIVLAATNTVNELDSALRRPGRFDRSVRVGLPNKDDREKILNLHLKGKPISSQLDVEYLAFLSAGWSGAALANLVNEAAITAAECSAPKITQAHCLDALDKITIGLKNTQKQTPQELKKIAIHEAGHTLLSLLTDQSVRKVTLASRGYAAGFTAMNRSIEDLSQLDKESLKNTIMIAFGGYLAEKLIYGHHTPGCSDDLEKASYIAHAMVTQWGMGDGDLEGKSLNNQWNSVHAIFEEEIQRLLSECREKATSLLTKNKSLLTTIAQELFKKETLTSTDLDQIIKEHKKD